MSPFFHSFFPLFYSVPALSFLCYSPVHRARNNFEKVEGNQIFRDFLPSECRTKLKTLLSWTKSRYLPDSLSMRIIKSNQKLTDDWRPLFVEFPSSHPLWKVFYKSSVLGRQFMRISGEGFLYRAFLFHFLTYKEIHMSVLQTCYLPAFVVDTSSSTAIKTANLVDWAIFRIVTLVLQRGSTMILCRLGAID